MYYVHPTISQCLRKSPGMIDNRPWIALFSQTGSEIVNISKRLGKYPDIIVTNQPKTSTNINSTILKACKSDELVTLPKKPTAEEYDKIFIDDAIITLHGWLRIIPGSVCDKYTIYNLHPGLIDEYPELKGKDPQQQVFNMLNTPKHVGCVIHRATAELDGGPILTSRRVINHYASPNNLIKGLHEMASDMWVDFFERKIYE